MKAFTFWAGRHVFYAIAISTAFPFLLLAQLIENKTGWNGATSFMAFFAIIYLIPAIYVAHKTAYYMAFDERHLGVAFRLAKSDLWLRLAFVPKIGGWFVPGGSHSDNVQSPYQGFAEIDCKNAFPHVFWISEWGKNADFPAGFRYQVMSIRHEPVGELEIVLVREGHDGQKTETKRWTVAREKFNDGQEVIGLLEQHLDVVFEKFDMSEICSLDEFEAYVRTVNWKLS